MEKEFVTYKQALALKELGFDEPCLLSLSWINGYNTYTEKSNEPNAWISSNVEIKYDFSQFKVDFKDVYHVEIQIPLYQQTFRWFRGVHELEGVPQKADSFSWFKFCIWKYTSNGKHRVNDAFDFEYKTYEEAEQACLDKLIEMIKNK